MNEAEHPLSLELTDDALLPSDVEDDIRSGYTPEPDETAFQIPPSERRLITQPYDLSVRAIVDQIKDKSLVLDPPYQRNYVWDNARASRLIESLLLNIPIPVCYFAEESDGKYAVVDGHQRLTSIWRYVNDGFRLKGLTALVEPTGPNGKLFKELGEREQRLLLGRTIRCIVITQDSHESIKFEVFERLNRNPMPLSDQEIRNAIYRGSFNQLIKTLAEKPKWLQVLGKKAPDKRMRDDELVLRLFAVNDKYLDYEEPLREFLNKYMRIKASKLDEAEKQRLVVLFEETVDKVSVVFDDHAFRLFNRGWEKRLNRALFDAVVVSLSRLPIEALLAKKGNINGMLQELCTVPEFLQAVSRSTADRASFFARIAMFSSALTKIGLDPHLPL